MGSILDERDTQDGPYRDASFPFDPALGVRLLGEIQAEGLRAAGALVDRLVHLVDGPPATGTEASGEGGPAGGTQPGPTGIDMGAVLPWFDLWRDLVERTSDTVQRFRVADPATGEFRVDLAGTSAPAHPLVVALTDGSGSTEMWLHNGTTTDHGELVPACGPLSGTDGKTLRCTVTIDPPRIDGLPPRSSRGFAIAVRTPKTAKPGTYRGVIQVQGAEAVWLPLEVVVPAPTA